MSFAPLNRPEDTGLLSHLFKDIVIKVPLILAGWTYSDRNYM